MEYPITEQTYILNTKLSASELNDELDNCIAKLSALSQVAAGIDFAQHSSRLIHYYWEIADDLIEEMEELRKEIMKHERNELLKCEFSL